MAIANLGSYWRRLDTSPVDAPAPGDGRHALPPHLQTAIDDGTIRPARNMPGYVGRHRAEVTP